MAQFSNGMDVTDFYRSLTGQSGAIKADPGYTPPGTSLTSRPVQTVKIGMDGNPVPAPSYHNLSDILAAFASGGAPGLSSSTPGANGTVALNKDQSQIAPSAYATGVWDPSMFVGVPNNPAIAPPSDTQVADGNVDPWTGMRIGSQLPVPTRAGFSSGSRRYSSASTGVPGVSIAAQPNPYGYLKAAPGMTQEQTHLALKAQANRQSPVATASPSSGSYLKGALASAAKGNNNAVDYYNQVYG